MIQVHATCTFFFIFHDIYIISYRLKKLHATFTCIMKLVSLCNRTFRLIVSFPGSEITSRYLRWNGCDISSTRGLHCSLLFRCTQGFQLLYKCTFLDKINFKWFLEWCRISFCLSDSSYLFLKNMVLIPKINGESDQHPFIRANKM